MPSHPSSAIKVLIVDPIPAVRRGLSCVLSTTPRERIKIVAEADSISVARDAIGKLEPDVCLVGLDFEINPASESIRNLVQAHNNTSFVLFPSRATEDDCETALRYGARGIYSRLADLSMLPRCVEEVYAGRLWFDRNVTARLLNALLTQTSLEADAPGWNSLTHQERSIAKLVIAGEINKQIASKLHMSSSTVAYNLTTIYRKLGVADRTGLMLFARKHGIL